MRFIGGSKEGTSCSCSCSCSTLGSSGSGWWSVGVLGSSLSELHPVSGLKVLSTV
jgi:hypothetical protein